MLKKTMLSCAIMALTAPAMAQDDNRHSLSVNIDNDSFINQSDRHYTHGTLFSWDSAAHDGSDAETLAGIARNIFLPSDADNSRYRYGFGLGQHIFTPTDVSRINPDPLDRPYAGWLYLHGSLSRDTGNTFERATLALGMIGPAALGEEVQNGWHALTNGILGGRKTRGWAYQLGNEATFQLTEEKKWRVPLSSGPVEVELLPQATLTAGNVFVYGALGGMVRFGQGLAADWGPARLQPGLAGSTALDATALNSGFGWYVFAGFESRAISHNAFLDGNSFSTSRSVRKNPFVTDFNLGTAAVFDWGRLSAIYTLRSAEFKTQPSGDDQFISLGVTILQ